MPPRQRFPRLNSRYDVKHLRDDLNRPGLLDQPVFMLASKLKRLIITFNGDDFYKMVNESAGTGIINISPNLRYEQIDTKLTSLLMRSSLNALYGKFTNLTGETELTDNSG